jgi:hypothetical protein
VTSGNEPTAVEEEPEETPVAEEREKEISALSPLKGLLLSFSERGLFSLSADHIADLKQRTIQMEAHGLTLFKNIGSGLELPGSNRARRVLIMLYLIMQHESLK